MKLVEGLRHFAEEMELYKDLVVMEEGEIRVAVALTDVSDEATIIIEDKIKVVEGSEKPDIRVTMEKGVFDRILKGESDFGALISRARMSDIRPINYQFLNHDRVQAVFEATKAMMTTFFTSGRLKMKELKEELAGEAHGAHPIPLVYWDGIRFAWYVVKKGEILNEEGERDPYPQVLVILKGKGTVTIDENELELRPNTVIYVPVNSVHQIRAEEDVETLWLAWKAPP